MSHIGIFSPAAPGHVNPMSCLGRALQARGHRITYFQLPDLESAITKAGLQFAPCCADEFPVGSMETLYSELGRLKGLAAMRHVLDWFRRESVALFAEMPGLLAAHAIDGLLIDQ